MKFSNTKAFYKYALRRYGRMIIQKDTQTPWGHLDYTLKFIGVNISGYFLIEYKNSSTMSDDVKNIYARGCKPEKTPSDRIKNVLKLTAHQSGLDFLETIYQSQKKSTS